MSPSSGELLRDHPDVPAAARAYIGGLERGDVDAAADAFSATCLYSRDTGPSRDGRIEVRDREAVRAFLRQRGRQPWLHHCEVVASSGRRHFVEGWVSDGEGTVLGSFCVSFEVDDDGRLCRSVAYSASPPVGSVGNDS
jgi:hypothetical protein